MHIVSPAAQSTALHDVEDWFARSEGPALGTVTRVSGLRTRADGSAIAVTGTALTGAATRSEKRIRIVQPGAETAEVVDDASSIAWLGEALATASGSVRLRSAPAWDAAAEFELPGSAAQLAAAPDARRLAIVVAPDQRDNWDTAPVPEAGDDPYSPAVYTSGHEAPRELWILDPADVATPLARVDCGSWNIWESAWIDDERIAVIASAESGETGWYHPVVGIVRATGFVDTAGAEPLEIVYRPVEEVQLADIVANGDVIAVIEGLASDRGLTVGRVVVTSAAPGTATTTSTARILDIGAEATHLVLRGDSLGWSGLRGLRTAAGVARLAAGTSADTRNTAGSNTAGSNSTGSNSTAPNTDDTSAHTNTVFFDGPETFAGTLPVIDLDASGALYALVESYTTAPRLERITPGTRTVLEDYAHDGTRALLRTAGTSRDVSWNAPDGTLVEGIVVVPDGPGPHPLLVTVHGGPVHAWRERWGIQNTERHPYAGLLAEHGIATFYPNPRGSVGRGQEFTRLVLGDMVGADVDDLISGIDHLASLGLVDPARVGVTGNSYGGLMSAWLAATSDRFAVAIASSPGTDLVSQHHLSNIPAFDEIFVAGRVETDVELYYSRSPLSRAHETTTPILITAGALDKTTPPSQAVELHQAIRRAGGPTELVIYPQQGHGIANFPETADFLARLLAWSRQFLRPGAE